MRPRYADLFRKLRNTDPVKQDAAFDAILFDRAEALPDIVECYRTTPDEPLIRYFMVQLMGFSGAKAAITPLIEALDDKDPLVRAEACRGLEDLKAVSATRHLMARLNDVHEEVREAAADALAAFKA